MTGLTPGFVKTAPVAWYASHSHGTDGSNQIYSYSYLYAYTIDVPAGAKSLTLPANERIRILAVTAARANEATEPAQPLYDTLEIPTTVAPEVITQVREEAELAEELFANSASFHFPAQIVITLFKVLRMQLN